MEQQSIFFFFDDSGVFHRNNEFFVYAGYMFFGSNEKDAARRKYKALVKAIKAKLGRDDELKAYILSGKHKRALLRILKNYMRLAVVVDLKKVNANILDDKRSRVRFKDFALKRIIKKSIKKAIADGKLNSNDYFKIYLNVDEQSTATNGVYGLHDSIKEELLYGIPNHDYSVFYEPIIHGGLDVVLRYCQSENEYLIQAADILANTVYNDIQRENRKIDEDIMILMLP